MEGVIELFAVLGAVVVLATVLMALAANEKQKEETQKLAARIRRELDQHDGNIERRDAAVIKLQKLFPGVMEDHLHHDLLFKAITEINVEAPDIVDFDPNNMQRTLQNLVSRREHFRASRKACEDLARNIRESKYTLLARHGHRIPDSDFYFPPWEGDEEDVIIPSLYEDEQGYTVNLAARSCTCEYLVTIPDEIPRDDVRRVCRHQIKAIKEKDPQVLTRKDLWGPRARVIAEAPHREHFYGILNVPDAGSFYIGYSVPLEWVSLFLDPTDSEKTYGYNMLRKDWAYGYPPKPYTEQTRKAILDYFSLLDYRRK